MTTYTNFAPSVVAPFQFQATLDGQQYNVVITWNVFGQRFYINVFDLSGNLIVCEGMIGSPNGIALSSLVWNANSSTVIATTASPHGYKIGRVIGLTIVGCTPSAYNGTFDCLINGASTFSYPQSTDPGMATLLGTAQYNINMVGGYFSDSSLVYRTQANQFEVSP